MENRVNLNKRIRCPRCSRPMTEIVSMEDDDGFAQRQWQCPKDRTTTPMFSGDSIRCEIEAHYWVDHYVRK